MSAAKFRWSKVYESSEEELVEFLRSRNLQAERIVAEDGSDRQQPTADGDVTIWCAEGSLTVRIGQKNTSLQPGDALRIPAGTSWELQPGMFGYVCYLTV